MFNLGITELILILLIAFVVVGPKDLPKIARALGRFVRRARALIEEVKREAGLDEIEQEFTAVREDARLTMRQADIREPLSGAKRELEGEITAVRREIDDLKTDLNDK